MHLDSSGSWYLALSKKIRFPDGSYTEDLGFDSNQDFSNFRSRTNTGIQIVEEEKEDE